MGVILTLGTMILGILIPILIMLYTGWDLINFSLMFVVPVGAIAVGYVCGFGYFKSLVKADKKIDKGHYITGVILALICFSAIMYGQYYITCIDDAGYITYSLSGDHISNYIHDDYGPLTFFNFIIYNIETAVVSFSHRTTEIGTVENVTLNYVFFVVNIIGIIYGFISSGFGRSGQPYCDKCRKYKKDIEISDIPKENMDEIISEIEKLAKINDNGDSLKEYLGNYKIDDKLKKQEHLEGELSFCEECKSAVFKLSLYEFSKKNKLDINSNYSKEIPVSYEIVEYYQNLYKNDYLSMFKKDEADLKEA